MFTKSDPTNIWTHDEIQAAMRDKGSHWWDPDTMRHFGTRLCGPVFCGDGGVYFVTSEKPPHGPRAYTVRQYKPESADVDTIGELCGFNTRQTAINQARRLSGTGDYRAATFHPVGDFEQFLSDLHRHGCHCSMGQARELIRLAKRHQAKMEDYCNGVDPYDENGEPKKPLARCRSGIESIVKTIGAAGVVFSGDPRGCTVKLRFRDGATNDWGSEGWCIPMNR